MLENFRTQKIVWDKANMNIFEKITANTGDTNGRKLLVQVTDLGEVQDLTGSSLNLAWKSNANKTQGLDAFTPVDITRGLFEIHYTTGMLSNRGTLTASLILVGVDGRIESNAFNIILSNSVVNDEVVQSENSFTVLTEALVKLNKYQSEIDEIKQDLVNESTKLITTEKAELDALQLDYAERAETLEETYAPRLTEVAAQLAQTQYKPIGLNHRNNALFDTNFEREGMVSFVSDDGNIEDMTHFKPLFDQYGFKFTMAIQTDYVGGTDTNGNQVMTWEQIKEMYNEGYTVAAHTLSHPHLGDLSYEENEKELKESRDILLSKGFDVRHIMYPYGDYNDYTRTLTEKYYLSGATVVATFNSPSTSRSIINRYSILDPAKTVEQLKVAVDTAIENNYWLVFYMHGYEMQNSNFVNKLKGLLEHIKEKKVPVVTYDDGYDYFIRKKPITEIPTAKVGSYHMTTSQSINNSVPHVTVDMPNFNSQRTNTDNFYFFNREKNRIEFTQAGSYIIEYGLLFSLEKDAQAFLQIIFGAERAGTTVLSRELHQNFYVSQAYIDKENGNQRPYPVNGYAVASFEQGSYDKFFFSLPIRIKGQTMTKQNNISSWGESSHITITKLS